jgi:hypothetical protein
MLDGAKGAAFMTCNFTRVGATALLITGASEDVQVNSCDFYKPGGNAIAVVGYSPRSNASAAAGAETPARVTIASSIFEGIGVYGKQTSALFISLATNVSLLGSELYTGPRAGVNVNDGHGGGHAVEDNVIFDWVRETQVGCFARCARARGARAYPPRAAP